MEGFVRYSAKRLQLCTDVGWRNIALDIDPPRCAREINVPERNLRAFFDGYPGIMFQFNNDTKPIVNPKDYSGNITAGLLRVSWNIPYMKYSCGGIKFLYSQRQLKYSLFSLSRDDIWENSSDTGFKKCGALIPEPM